MNDAASRLEERLRAGHVPDPPAALLDSLRRDIPADVRAGDPDRFRRSRYFDRPSSLIAAASVVMLFSFTFLVARIILTNAAERELPSITEAAPDATKISDSAAEERPVGAAARRRPPPAEIVQDTAESGRPDVAAPSAEMLTEQRPARESSMGVVNDSDSTRPKGTRAVTPEALHPVGPQASASAASGSLSGTAVLDGEALPGVTVRLTSPSLESERLAVTDAAGRYEFFPLADGEYEVGFTMEGMRSVTRKVELRGGVAASSPVALRTAQAAQELTVTASAPPVTEAVAVAAPPPPPAREEALRLEPVAKSFAANTVLRPLHAPRLEEPLPLPDELTVVFTISGDGRVHAVRLVGTELDAATETTLFELLRRWRFPAGQADSAIMTELRMKIRTDDVQPLDD